MKAGHVDDIITVTLRRGDALAVGQSIRSLARTKLGARTSVPLGIRPQLDSVGMALALAAINAPTEPKP